MRLITKLNIVLILFSTILISGKLYKDDIKKSYSELWECVIDSQKKDKPKTTLKIANLLVKKSEAENNDPELLKALILIKQLKESYYEKKNFYKCSLYFDGDYCFSLYNWLL